MCVVLLHALTSDWHGCSHAHPSCCPPGFSAPPSSKYTPLEKPFEEIPPSPTPHTKNIQPRPPLHPLHARWLFCLPPFTYCCDAAQLLSFLSLCSFSSLLVPLFFQLGFSADTVNRPSLLQGSQWLLQPTQLTTQAVNIRALGEQTSFQDTRRQTQGRRRDAATASKCISFLWAKSLKLHFPFLEE